MSILQLIVVNKKTRLNSQGFPLAELYEIGGLCTPGIREQFQGF